MVTREQFNELVDDTALQLKTVLSGKAAEYAGKSEKDRLHNFKKATLFNGLVEDNHHSPEFALWGMLAKHIVSISDMVDGNTLPENITPALIEEKLGDAICYLTLLKAMLYEKMEYQPMMQTPAPIVRYND